MRDRMSIFVLVHGAWHGAWCWERLIDELRARGHHAVAMDLPCEDGTATFETYADVVIDAMARGGDDIVLVGHSLGAMTIPVVASRRDIRLSVFLCGVVPKPGGLPWDDGPEMDPPGAYDALVRNGDGSTSWPTTEAATAAMYQDCTDADAEWAFEHLRAQNSTALWDRPYPLTSWPPGRYASIFTRDDRAISPEWSRFAARERLHVDPVELPGSHSPFVARPAALADALIDLAR
jgi:pimeloyl-ACP methyl ester carboxylesterase